jgi:protease-4
LGRQIGQGGQTVLCALANGRRRLLRRHLPDYVVIPLDQPLSERDPELPWWYGYIPGRKRPLSLEALSSALERIAADPDVRGVVLLCQGLELSLAQAQSQAQLLDRFRGWDRDQRAAHAAAKEVVVYLEQVTPAAYVAACAADRMILPPLATWEVVGLRVAPTYWQETLARAGLEVEVIKVAPWKTAVDTLTRADMSTAEREQYSWLLDSLTNDVVSAIAQGRRLAPDQVRARIDQAPLTAEETVAAGLADAIGYEDQLPTLLGTAERPARLKLYAQVRGLLLRRPRPTLPQRIGVLSLQGSIVVGHSRTFPVPLPLLGGRLMGSHTVVQQIRAARRDPRLAAVVVHIDSGGGSALASDLIWRELKQLDQAKPVVVYLGNVAASGGYYIAAPGRKIVAQPASLTGSIGVVLAKPVTAGLRAKLGAHREVIRRGEHAGLYADDQPWTPSERRKLEESVFAVYDRFKAIVAEGRALPVLTLDPLAGGKVWTGRQAQAQGLVDELGDFQVAVDLACRAAGLPAGSRARTRAIPAPRTRLPAEPADPVHALGGWEAVRLLGDWARLLGREHIWLIAPDLPRVEGLS